MNLPSRASLATRASIMAWLSGRTRGQRRLGHGGEGERGERFSILHPARRTVAFDIAVAVCEPLQESQAKADDRNRLHAWSIRRARIGQGDACDAKSLACCHQATSTRSSQSL
jgi:hypothetical protein